MAEEPVDKSEFLESFEQMRPDLFYEGVWTDEEQQEVAEIVRPQRMRTSMYASIPMNCTASKCPFADTCPLQMKGIAPEGKPCPIEMGMVVQFQADYMRELNVSENNVIESSMIRDLVDQEIQYLRKTKILAKEHFIQENIIGINEKTGEPFFRQELHAAVEFEDKIHRRRKDLRNQLLATREAKAKAGLGDKDTARDLADMYDKIANIDHKREELLKKRLGLAETSEYVDDDYTIIDAKEVPEVTEDD